MFLVSVVTTCRRIKDPHLAEGRLTADPGEGHGQGRAAHLQGVVLADGPDRGQVDQERGPHPSPAHHKPGQVHICKGLLISPVAFFELAGIHY